MSPRRLWLVLREDAKELRGRPLFWIWLVVLGLTAWALSHGQMRISSGDAAVGGTKAWITSEFAIGQTFAMVGLLFYAFFIAVLSGMSLIRDDELRVGEVLHATPLLPGEYVWGKYLATLAGTLVVLLAHLLLTVLFYQLAPADNADEIRGPFALAHYVRPVIVFALPLIILLTGASFWLGAVGRRPVLVFVLPVALVLVCGFFLWNWAPTWLDPRINRVLMLLEPTGFRWLNETWLKVDRGVQFYNTAPIQLDFAFAASRVALVVAGLTCVAAAQRRFGATLRGAKGARSQARRWRWAKGRTAEWPLARTDARPRAKAAGPAVAAIPVQAAGDLRAALLRGGLQRLGMRHRHTGLVSGVLDVARFELRELAGAPGLYLFIPIILMQILGTSLLALGAFDTPVLLTSGTAAVNAMNTITLLVVLLLLFYTVESLQREASTRLAPIYNATAIRTASMLFGKALANTLIGVLVMAAAFLGCAIAILVQGRVGVDLFPFLLVWGALLVPTFLLWSSFTAMVYALTRNRYTTYALGLGVLSLTGWLQMTGRMNWAGNWDVWSVVLWSDMGPLPLDRTPLLLNRLAALGLTVLFTAITVRCYPRCEADPTRVVHRAAPGNLARAGLRLLPYAVAPAAAIVALVVLVRGGPEGPALREKEHDYWKQNLATWKDAPLPAVRLADIDLQLQPSRHWFRVEGSYHVFNHRPDPLLAVPLTGGYHWEDVRWTLNGQPITPEDRTRLYVIRPDSPLAPGDSMVIGFAFEGRFPAGSSKNGGRRPEFILPSGVVLTSFTPSFVPVMGFDEERGVDDRKNRYEPKVYPDDFHTAVLEPAFGTQHPMRTRVRIIGPAEFAYNSVGTLVAEEVAAGTRTVVWESDHPVRFFNVVAGRWTEVKGEGTRVFHHPAHAYNVPEISQGLQAARRWYSEWFRPYPWTELKLSEFPALDFYAQGFPTNITFSEGIGFLTKSDPKTNLAFMVTAHEAAHQWWGNLLTPGKGPGGDILSEGMAHYSTMLLMQQAKGEHARIEFCKRIEERYGDRRQADSERPLVKIDGSKPGDQTVMYDKGSWVMWMLDRLMGRDAMLAGLREFMARYGDGPDYPVLQDLITTLRPHAPDSTAFDAQVAQSFHQVVVPAFRILEARRERTPAAPPVARPAATLPAAGAVQPSSAAGDSGRGEQWLVTARVANRGTGLFPVELAAVCGERFPGEAKAATPGSEVTPGTAAAVDGGREPGDYREVRTGLLLQPGEEREVTLRCDFQPQQLVFDPDAVVLQLHRKSALYRF